MTRDNLKDTQDLGEIKKIALNLFDENKILQEQIKVLQSRIFGRKSEKTTRDDGQLSLFEIPDPEFPVQEEPETVSIAEHKGPSVAADPCLRIFPVLMPSMNSAKIKGNAVADV